MPRSNMQKGETVKEQIQSLSMDDMTAKRAHDHLIVLSRRTENIIRKIAALDADFGGGISTGDFAAGMYSLLSGRGEVFSPCHRTAMRMVYCCGTSLMLLAGMVCVDCGQPYLISNLVKAGMRVTFSQFLQGLYPTIKRLTVRKDQQTTSRAATGQYSRKGELMKSKEAVATKSLGGN